MRISVELGEPKYTSDELAALKLLSPLMDAMATAVNAIHEAAYYREQTEYWRRECVESQNQALKHGEAMMANLLMATVKGAIRPIERDEA